MSTLHRDEMERRRVNETVTRHLVHNWASKLQQVADTLAETIERIEVANGVEFSEESLRAFYISCMIENSRNNGTLNIDRAIENEASRVTASFDKEDILAAVNAACDMVGINHSKFTESKPAKMLVLEYLTQLSDGELDV